jgi:DNA-directed RNA polymerase beta' subunit
VVVQTSNEGFNSLVVGDPRNPDAHIQEASDVVTQWFVPSITDALQIVLQGCSQVAMKFSTKA